MRQPACWIAFLCFCLPAAAADRGPYQQWLVFKEDMALQAAGPTGMYAIQDMLVLQPGETAFLRSGKSADDARWSSKPHEETAARVDYQDGRATITGPGIQARDLVQAPDRRMLLPNGLTVRVSFLQQSLKVWLYNPKLLAQRKFKGLAYYPYDPLGVVSGTFRRSDAPRAVNYLDSRDHAGVMYVMGTLGVTIGDQRYELNAYSYSSDWKEIDALLFLLKDRTSGKTTYGGGRVVEAQFRKGAPPTAMTLNLNTAYSFLCAHSEYYNCPLILVSVIDAELKYGEKYPPEHQDAVQFRAAGD
jgi:hypothetical protein